MVRSVWCGFKQPRDDTSIPHVPGDQMLRIESALQRQGRLNPGRTTMSDGSDQDTSTIMHLRRKSTVRRTGRKAPGCGEHLSRFAPSPKWIRRLAADARSAELRRAYRSASAVAIVVQSTAKPKIQLGMIQRCPNTAKKSSAMAIANTKAESALSRSNENELSCRWRERAWIGVEVFS